MSFQIIGKTKDLKSGADVIYVQSSINKYLEIVGSDFENFSIWQSLIVQLKDCHINTFLSVTPICYIQDRIVDKVAMFYS